jgi:hypothetical protein
VQEKNIRQLQMDMRQSEERVKSLQEEMGSELRDELSAGDKEELRTLLEEVPRLKTKLQEAQQARTEARQPRACGEAVGDRCALAGGDQQVEAGDQPAHQPFQAAR